jgi:hypothetical protein
MCNAFTLVSTDPRVLEQELPMAQGASATMHEIRAACPTAVAAWGALITKVRGGEDHTERLKRELSPLHCLGMTKQGYPKHPLYVPYSQQLERMEAQ